MTGVPIKQEIEQSEHHKSKIFQFNDFLKVSLSPNSKNVVKYKISLRQKWGNSSSHLLIFLIAVLLRKKKTPKKQGKENELRNNVKHSKLSTKFSIEYLEKKTNVCWIYIKAKAKTNEAITARFFQPIVW